ncbi:adhesion G protein-coupled receptor B1-like [Exaiptasia diaphana]|uniref:Uncharacterized protein n=1 Tax=Exaiptasia diaphana TaxID=2652724 RepID=A0A913YKD3_EXADI|nr:adhesion G protein-coupled receptor B1-like [Exaiptasia diaphana]
MLLCKFLLSLDVFNSFTSSERQRDDASTPPAPSTGKIVYGTWTKWAEACISNCGLGTRISSRTCKISSSQGSGNICSGPTQKEGTCYVNMCKNDTAVIHPFEGIGCYKGRNDNNNRLLPVVATNFRDGILWEEYNDSLTAVVYRCALDVQLHYKEFQYFGIEFYGECYTSNATLLSLPEDKKTDCFKSKPNVFVGRDKTIFVYKFSPVNGTWGEWGQWNLCSKTCGAGFKKRTRQCNKPAPRWGGLDCQGSSTNRTACNTIDCPVIANWSEWQLWGSCNKHCGLGTRTRHRTCSTTKKPCDGHAHETVECYLEMCKEQSSKIFPFQGIGCFSTNPKQLLAKLISAKFRDNLVWHSGDSVAAPVLRCAASIQNNHSQYQHFGIEYYGECWTGNVTEELLENNQIEIDRCYKVNSKVYVGKADTMYIYKFNPGNQSHSQPLLSASPASCVRT